MDEQRNVLSGEYLEVIYTCPEFVWLPVTLQLYCLSALSVGVAEEVDTLMAGRTVRDACSPPG